MYVARSRRSFLHRTISPPKEPYDDCRERATASLGSTSSSTQPSCTSHSSSTWMYGLRGSSAPDACPALFNGKRNNKIRILVRCEVSHLVCPVLLNPTYAAMELALARVHGY